MMLWDYGAGWGYLFMAMWMVAFWGLVIGAILLIVRAATTESRVSVPVAPATDPRRMLAQRYARGEIDEEFRDRLGMPLGGTPRGR